MTFSSVIAVVTLHGWLLHVGYVVIFMVHNYVLLPSVNFTGISNIALRVCRQRAQQSITYIYIYIYKIPLRSGLTGAQRDRG